MTGKKRALLSRYRGDAKKSVHDSWRVLKHRGPGQLQFWLIALVIGISAGFAALLFRKGINALQAWAYGTDDLNRLHTFAGTLPWYVLLLIPVLGGLTVGVILNWFTPDGRVRSVADVIEAAALHKGQVEHRAGLASALASLITLSTGGSTGREGPVVHLAAVISSWISRRIKADNITGRDLLACAVAAAVSASFNAPIAGAVFALEVVLRHFAINAFAPIVIAAAAGTVINRLEFGDVTEFTLMGDGGLSYYVELPAFLLLGLVCGVVAVILMRSILISDDIGSWVQKKIHLPPVLRPALAGLMLGGIAIAYPHIIGIGYETVSAALTGQLLLWNVIIFTVVKVIAVSVTMAGRMGGGVFSPALMVGALTGLGFGLIATGIFPDVSGSETLYALAGMGAVAAAVLGAPISTTLIVFELTGDWQTGLAVMVAVSTSTALASHWVHRSFFLTQLVRRGIHIADGPQTWLLSSSKVQAAMLDLHQTRAPRREACELLIAQGVQIADTDSLEQAMAMFEADAAPDFIPVLRCHEEGEAPQLCGVLFEVDALRYYARALSKTAAEEHS
jgi:chloride channel protein, CIC family